MRLRGALAWISPYSSLKNEKKAVFSTSAWGLNGSGAERPGIRRRQFSLLQSSFSGTLPKFCALWYKIEFKLLIRSLDRLQVDYANSLVSGRFKDQAKRNDSFGFSSLFSYAFPLWEMYKEEEIWNRVKTAPKQHGNKSNTHMSRSRFYSIHFLLHISNMRSLHTIVTFPY